MKKSTLLEIVLGGHFRPSHHRYLVFSEPLPRQPPHGVPQDAWDELLAAQARVTRASSSQARKEAMVVFKEACDFLPREALDEFDPIGFKYILSGPSKMDALEVAGGDEVVASGMLDDFAEWKRIWGNRHSAGEPVPRPPHWQKFCNEERGFQGARARAGVRTWLADDADRPPVSEAERAHLLAAAKGKRMLAGRYLQNEVPHFEKLAENRHDLGEPGFFRGKARTLREEAAKLEAEADELEAA